MTEVLSQKEIDDLLSGAKDPRVQELIEKILANNETDRCKWFRAFDNNFNISCVNETGQRASGNFKGKDIGAKWEFIYCPYCGKEIDEVKTDGEKGGYGGNT